MKLTLGLALLSSPLVAACPGSDAWIHAKCSMEVTFQESCNTVMTEMVARANGDNGWVDPHNGGTYTFSSTTPTDITGSRTTGDGKYTDKYDFSFEDSNGGCKVSACSESQVNSVLDYSTNYCNLHSLYCSSTDGCPTVGADLTYTEDFKSCKQHDDVCVASAQPAQTALRGGSKAEGGCKPVTTKTGFDLDSYINGKWYIQEQAVTKYLPEEQNYCVYAEYSKLDKKSFWGYTIQVHNYAQEADGTSHDSGDLLVAKQTDANDPAKLAVSPYFLPSLAAGPYWVLEYDEALGYALISGGQPDIDTGNGCKCGDGVNDSGLWIFTRSQDRDEELVQMVRGKAQAQGFDISVLNTVDQTNCAKDM